MTTYHVLNGDHPADELRQTKINQDFIVCRECLIEGNVNADNMADFWTMRANLLLTPTTFQPKNILVKP